MPTFHHLSIEMVLILLLFSIYDFQMLIPSKYLNVSVEDINQRRLCGTDVYTDDSDIVALSAHVGAFQPTEVVGEFDEWEGLVVSILVSLPVERYQGSSRNSIDSSTWEGDSLRSIKIVDSQWLPKTKRRKTIDPENRVLTASELDDIESRRIGKTLRGWITKEENVIRGLTFVCGVDGGLWVKYSLGVVGDCPYRGARFLSVRLQKKKLLMDVNGVQDRGIYVLHYVPLEIPHENGSGETEKGEKKDVDAETGAKKEKEDVNLQLRLEKKRIDGGGGCDVIYDDLLWDELEWSHVGLKVRTLDLHIEKVLYESVTVE
eukprot:TRINITY_DN32869_c0_g2_i2.p1 TRINITY_DN32869_c0_g2~~TRINITY_DN32869_c0_g2_i2.p1  ORF type:complete len:318 (+),score=94.14 TRINITY_DN32869_c0_g2_i2:67-1020(+)